MLGVCGSDFSSTFLAHRQHAQWSLFNISHYMALYSLADRCLYFDSFAGNADMARVWRISNEAILGRKLSHQHRWWKRGGCWAQKQDWWLIIHKVFFIWLGHFLCLVQLLDSYQSFAGQTDRQTDKQTNIQVFFNHFLWLLGFVWMCKVTYSSLFCVVILYVFWDVTCAEVSWVRMYEGFFHFLFHFNCFIFLVDDIHEVFQLHVYAWHPMDCLLIDLVCFS